jgi:hypothetical protein
MDDQEVQEVNKNMDDKEFYDYSTTKLNEIPKDFLCAVVNFLRQDMPLNIKNYINDLFNEYGLGWQFGKGQDGVPCGWGMMVRNRLRMAGFLDCQLPDGNWDDYYTPCIELAVGIRDSKDISEMEFSKTFWSRLFWRETRSNIRYRIVYFKYKIGKFFNMKKYRNIIMPKI